MIEFYFLLPCLWAPLTLSHGRSRRLVSNFHFWRKSVSAGAAVRWVDGWCWEVWRHSDAGTPLLSITKLFPTAVLHTVLQRYPSRGVRGYSWHMGVTYLSQIWLTGRMDGWTDEWMNKLEMTETPDVVQRYRQATVPKILLSQFKVDQRVALEKSSWSVQTRRVGWGEKVKGVSIKLCTWSMWLKRHQLFIAKRPTPNIYLTVVDG